MPDLSTTFALETSFRVPGLGVLLVPAAPAAACLAGYALHTALAVNLVLPEKPTMVLTGTVEELAHDDQPPRRALLLDFDPGGPLPSGTLVQLGDALPALL